MIKRVSPRIELNEKLIIFKGYNLFEGKNIQFKYYPELQQFLGNYLNYDYYKLVYKYMSDINFHLFHEHSNIIRLNNLSDYVLGRKTIRFGYVYIRDYEFLIFERYHVKQILKIKKLINFL